jgi:hypothetical protein
VGETFGAVSSTLLYFVRSSTAASVAELSGNSQIYDG